MIPAGSQIIRLKPDYVCPAFDCGDADLNDFIQSDAIGYLTQKLAVSYLLVDSNQELIAYYSLLNDKITALESKSNRWFKSNIKILLPDSKHFSSYPAVKIGRLAVSTPYQKNHIGQAILDYLKFSFVNGNKTGCRFITVDAYQESIPFYEKNGFSFLIEKEGKRSHTRLMYFDLDNLDDIDNTYDITQN